MDETIICYDISCPRRLGRIYRYLCRRALPIQYSVFLFSGTRRQLDACLRDLADLMDTSQDDIRAYPLPRRGLRWRLGEPALPEGVFTPAVDGHWQGHKPVRPAAAAPADPDAHAALQWTIV